MMIPVIRILLIVLVLGGLYACATPGKKSGNLFSDEGARADINRAITAWEVEHDYARAVYGLETVLNENSGHSINLAALGGLVYVHFQKGNIEAFKENMPRLEKYFDSENKRNLTLYFSEDPRVIVDYLVYMEIYNALVGKPAELLSGGVHDPHRVRGIYQTLGMQP